MKSTIYKISAAIALILSSMTANAQTEVTPFFGSNWGATTSFGTPAETREIKSSNLLFNYVIGCDVTQMLSDKWGIDTGLRYERKASGSNVVMKNFLTTITLAGAGTPTHGYFSGNVKNINDNSYITLPVMAVYRTNSKWDVRGGMYFSYALRRKYTGEATDGKIRQNPTIPATAVTYSTSDFSDDISKFDCGVQLGVVRPIWKNLKCNVDLNWGLINTLNSEASGMTMNVYNLYLCVGLGWQL